MTVGTTADPAQFASQVYAPASADPLTTRTIPFVVPAANTDIRVTFTNAGGDNVGAVLDNVQVSDFGPAAVPDPASVALLTAGGLGLLARRRLRRR